MLSPFAALAGVVVLLPQAPAAPHADTTTIVIAATTDVHGRVMAWDYERDREAPLGLVRVATVVDSLRRRHPGRVVLLDAGDLLQGNSFATYYATASRSVHPIVEAMNRMGYDAVTPGNHDFNYGLEFLARARAGARYPYVSATIVREPGGEPAFEPYRIVEKGGVRIGITGATTPGVMVWDGPTVRGRLRFADLATAVPPVVRRMKAAGADVTVLVAHAHLDEPSSYAEPGVPPENNVAAAVTAAPQLDVAFLGHVHFRELADSTIGGTLVAQARHHAQSLAVVEVGLQRRAGRWQVVRKRGVTVRLGEVRPDNGLVRALQGPHDSARAFALRPLGTSASALSARTARLEDTPIIDFVNAVQRRRTGAQLSSTAAFDTRAEIPAGPVSLAQLSALYPYENTLKAIQLSGADLRAYLEQSARYYRGMGPDGPIVNDSIQGYNFDIVSGAEYELDLSRPIGQRVVSLRFEGREVADTDSFTMAVNNYRQQGGGGFTMVSRAPVVYDRQEPIRDLLAEAVQRRGTLRAEDYFVRNWAIRGVRPSRDSVVLRVLATNDLHGALLSRTEPWSNGREVGGAAALSGMMRRLEAECACPTLRLDGGDVMQGRPISNLTAGRSTIEALNAMGYAAAAIGNHDFDWSVDTLAARVREARFAWLAANVRDSARGAVPPWARAWTMTRAGPLSVAVVGYALETTPTQTNPNHVRGLRFDDGPRRLDSVIAVARAERPDFVIVVAHAGAFCDREQGCRGEVIELARALRQRPDLIVSGHTHSLVETTVNGIPIIQARTGGTSLGVVDFVVEGGTRTARMRVETVWSDRERPDTAVARIVERYRLATDSQASREVASLAVPLRRQGEQYPLGNMIADAYREAAGAEVALVNNGGIRNGLEPGTVRWGSVFEVLPFQNFIVRLTVSGALLRRTLEHAVGGREARAHVSGLVARVDLTRRPGERVTGLMLSDGRPVRDEAEYTLAVPDFMANGGSGYAMLREVPREHAGVADLDAFIAYLRRQPQPIRRVPAEVRVDDGAGPRVGRSEDGPAPEPRERRP